MKQDSDILVIFTAEFPFGTREEFIAQDLHYASQKFRKVYLVPYNSVNANNHTRKLPDNVEVVSRLVRPESKWFFVKNIFWLVRLLFNEFHHSPDKKYFIKNSIQWLSKLKIANADKKFIRSLSIPDESVKVSYWVNEWATALAMLRRENKNYFFVCRSLGFDIWANRNKGGYLPFRYFCYQHANGIFANSNLAADYLKSLRIFSSKIFHSYLGTFDYGTAEVSHSDKLHIVSASSVIPLKRVHLIYESLRKMNRSLIWTHIGKNAEENYFEMSDELSTDNLTVKCVNYVDSLPEYIKSIKPDLFISLSLSEGLPVTITEVISLGIPVIATDAGGTREVVNNLTGRLIPVDVSADDVVSELHEFVNKNLHVELRKSCRAFWKNNFTAQNTYYDFYEQLQRMKNT